MIDLTGKETADQRSGSAYHRSGRRAILLFMAKLSLIVAFVCLIGVAGVAEAQYVLVLKNGRQITVQSYREEGSMIKFSGMGGEIAIGKDQVQSIRRAGEADRGAIPSLAVDRAPPSTPPQAPSTVVKPAAVRPSTPPLSSDDQAAKNRAEEEKLYQDKIKEVTEQLRELRERYSLITRGNKGPEPSFFTTEEAFRGHQEDLLSRLRDAQYKAQGLPSGGSATSPPFSLDAPPAYSERQKQLSDLRARIGELETNRERLIAEMKAKNFETGSLFLD